MSLRKCNTLRTLGALVSVMVLVSAWPAGSQALSAAPAGLVRRQGLEQSQAYRYVNDLTTKIGARLMGSPNMSKADAGDSDVPAVEALGHAQASAPAALAIRKHADQLGAEHGPRMELPGITLRGW